MTPDVVVMLCGPVVDTPVVGTPPVGIGLDFPGGVPTDDSGPPGFLFCLLAIICLSCWRCTSALA